MDRDWIEAQRQYEELIARQNRPTMTFRVGADLTDQVAEWAGQYGKDWTMWTNLAHEVVYYPHGGSCWYHKHAIIQIARDDHFMFYFVFADEILRGPAEMSGRHDVDTMTYEGIQFLPDPDADRDLYPGAYSLAEAMADHPMDMDDPDWVEAQANFDAALAE